MLIFFGQHARMSYMRKEVASKGEIETIEWLSKLRWPSGPICQSCKKRETSRLIKTRGLYQCTNCRIQFSVFSGTRFEGTRLKPMDLSVGIIRFWEASVKNGHTVKWRGGMIGVRVFHRLVPQLSYSTAQRLHKKLAATPFSPDLSLDKYISNLLR